jgi:hypothetical protein
MSDNNVLTSNAYYPFPNPNKSLSRNKTVVWKKVIIVHVTYLAHKEKKKEDEKYSDIVLTDPLILLPTIYTMVPTIHRSHIAFYHTPIQANLG